MNAQIETDVAPPPEEWQLTSHKERVAVAPYHAPIREILLNHPDGLSSSELCKLLLPLLVDNYGDFDASRVSGWLTRMWEHRMVRPCTDCPPYRYVLACSKHPVWPTPKYPARYAVRTITLIENDPANQSGA